MVDPLRAQRGDCIRAALSRSSSATRLSLFSGSTILTLWPYLPRGRRPRRRSSSLLTRPQRVPSPAPRAGVIHSAAGAFTGAQGRALHPSLARASVLTGPRAGALHSAAGAYAGALLCGRRPRRRTSSAAGAYAGALHSAAGVYAGALLPRPAPSPEPRAAHVPRLGCLRVPGSSTHCTQPFRFTSFKRLVSI